jgi:hypothetical protein
VQLATAIPGFGLYKGQYAVLNAQQVCDDTIPEGTDPRYCPSWHATRAHHENFIAGEVVVQRDTRFAASAVVCRHRVVSLQVAEQLELSELAVFHRPVFLFLC